MKRQHDVSATSKNTSSPEKIASGISNTSIIIFWFTKLSNAIYDAIVNGFFGRIFSAYSSELASYHNGFIYSRFRGGSKVRVFFRKSRAYLSRNFESSVILLWLRRYICGLTNVSVRSYGRFLTSFGIYTLLIYFIKALVPMAGEADVDYLLVGSGVCFISIPLHFSNLSLASAVKKSRLTKALFMDALGYREEIFDTHSKNESSHAGVPILYGLIFGILTFIIHPLTLIICLLAFVVVSVIMVSPEVGILLGLFGLPFFSFSGSPTVFLAAVIAVTTFSYIIKLVRGKRILKFELLDFIILIFMIMIFLSGAVTIGGRGSYHAALMSIMLMCGYFLVVNLIRTERWLQRCVLAIVSSGSIVALIGVAQYLLGRVSRDWLDLSYFSDIQGRATSLFENPNYLSAYLAMVFPFVLYKIINCKPPKEKLLCVICGATVLTCAVLTWSRGAWLAILCCTAIFLLMFSRKALKWIFCVAAISPLIPLALSDNIVKRFLSIGDISDSSTMYRIYTWKGSISMLKEYLWGGIGYGTEAFSEVYPLYAYAGIEAAAHSHNLYIQIALGMGIGGLLCFLLAMLFYSQYCFEYIKRPFNDNTRVLTIASFVSVVAMLIMGLFDYVWYNYRLFFMFWAVLAIGVSAMKLGNKELERSAILQDSTVTAATVDVEL